MARDRHGPRLTNDTALLTLETCLTDTSLTSTVWRFEHSATDNGVGTVNLDAESHCSCVDCEGLPDDQWKIEARRRFERYLARINTISLILCGLPLLFGLLRKHGRVSPTSIELYVGLGNTEVLAGPTSMLRVSLAFSAWLPSLR